MEIGIDSFAATIPDPVTGHMVAPAERIEALLAEDVRFILCGQSAAALGIQRQSLAPGVQMALSAMTAHALLQQQGYTLNPF